MRPFRLAASLLPCLSAALGVAGEPNRQAIEDVASGKRTEAKASWWGFDEVDSTAALQAAIRSRVPKLIIDDPGKPWIVEPIHLVSDQEIVLEAGVTVQAKRGAFQGGNDSLFNIIGKENVTLRGYGATLRMWRDDYAKAPYRKAEWRMAVNLGGVRDVKILGLTLRESGGDGIYVGAGRDGGPCRDVLIKDVVCDANYRQGISVITAENLLIEGCVLRNTDGTAPRAGIDFEPNGPKERLVNCSMRDCVTEGNGGDGIAIYIPTLNATSEPVSLRFERCNAIGDRGRAVSIHTGNGEADAVGGSIEFVGCQLLGSQGGGIAVGGKPVGGLRLRFEDCTIADPAMEMPTRSPITLSAGADAVRSVGGIELSNVTIRDPLGRDPLDFIDGSGGLRVEAVTGTLILEHADRRDEVRITDEVLARWIPVLVFKAIAPVKVEGLTLRPAKPVAASERNAPPARLRGTASWALWAEEGQEVAFTVRHLPVARYAGSAVPVVVAAPSGAEAHRAEAPFEKETRMRFAAAETGVYRVTCAPGANHVEIADSTHPVSLSAEPRAIPFYATTGRFFFWVPRGTKEFAVRLVGQDGGESVKATLTDPKGKPVESADDILRAHQLTVELPEPSAGAIWSLLLERPSHGVLEDFRVDLLGVPPLLAGSADTVLVTDGG